ncbi:Stealth-CR1 domain-containing protein [Mycena chlorophos]|uniref:Stealth-CR1 domain-containing protein n=1 Tax=Mycena chlorophos TaxID=658473 RepID=A0A8H6VWA7_MYCCL|nr:Stealth-CR1 domain-containing protein [Mycena chlorophos]
MAILWNTTKLGSFFTTHTLPAPTTQHTLGGGRRGRRISWRGFLLSPTRLCTILLTVVISFCTITLLLRMSDVSVPVSVPSLGAVGGRLGSFVAGHWRLDSDVDAEQALWDWNSWADEHAAQQPFPPPSPRPYDVDGTTYDLFRAPTPPQALASRVIRPIRAHAAIPDSCIEHWVATGRWETPCEKGMVQDSRIDLVWVWVNGSDPLHFASRNDLLEETGYGNAKEARFREHDELRFSLRAAKTATEWWTDSVWHVVTGDVAAPRGVGTELDRELELELAAQREKEQADALAKVADDGMEKRAVLPVFGKEDDVAVAKTDSQTVAHAGQKRLGLVPQWLDVDCAFDGRKRGVPKSKGSEPPIVLHHDTQLFRFSSNTTSTPADAAEWLSLVLPSFNSHAIESQLSHLPPSSPAFQLGVADQIVACNDDAFLTQPTPQSAFHTTLYGPVMRMDVSLLVGGDNTGAGDGGGEWRSIPWSGRLLDERFATRKRPYTKHIPRAMSLPILHECMLAFAPFFANTPLSNFRGSHFAPREWEVNTIFLTAHFVIERHREALLWSWVVGRWGLSPPGGLGGRERGMLDMTAKNDMWAELAGMLGIRDSETREQLTKNGAASRTSLNDVEETLRKAGVRPPSAGAKENDPHGGTRAMDTRYNWVSQNGYSPTWKVVASRVGLDRSCIGHSTTEPAWSLFRRLILSDWQCGDQIISILLYGAPSGLGMFLPEASSPVDIEANRLENEAITLPPTLPPTSPAFPSNPRNFAARLIQRYSYAIGTSPYYFVGPRTANEARRLLDAARRKIDSGTNGRVGGAGLVCVNDDFEQDREAESGDRVMREWLAKTWPGKLVCER